MKSSGQRCYSIYNHSKEIVTVPNQFTTAVIIHAAAAIVWDVLTTPANMLTWMGDPEMELAVDTHWQVGGPILITGFHHARFENRGRVLEFEKEQVFSYTQLSSVSRLPDVPDNYSVLRFVLTAVDGGTQLTLHIHNFPTEIIRKHLEFYWRTTVIKIKKRVEAL